MNREMTKELNTLATDYFTCLAENFPVMCASDEFDFFPRVQSARHFYHRLDDLSANHIERFLSTLRTFKEAIQTVNGPENDLEWDMDRTLLEGSIASICTEFRDKASWRHNPLLYLKIATIGLDHAFTKPADDNKIREYRVLARLQAIARLMHQATENLNAIPPPYHTAALSMITDSRAYLLELAEGHPPPFSVSGTKAFRQNWEKAFQSLQVFKKFLLAHPPVSEKKNRPTTTLNHLLKNRFLCHRTADEIFEIGRDEWHNNLEKLDTLRRKMGTKKPWESLYHAYNPSGLFAHTLMARYREESERLKTFFENHGFKGMMQQASLVVKETPTYLRSVRGTASFSAALYPSDKESDFFYITTRYKAAKGDATPNLLTKRLNREYRFLAAHETVPGHHLLDHRRRGLKNRIRRQIESPLFYEGWACYAETLLAEYGYLDTPLEQVIDCKRRLWRAARCQIDVGLNTGHLTCGDAIDLLVQAGFSKQEALNQANRYHLNPGYQLCYTVGLYEFLTLKKRFGHHLGLDLFHRRVLEGGELPFPFIAQRLEQSLLNRKITASGRER